MSDKLFKFVEDKNNLTEFAKSIDKDKDPAQEYVEKYSETIWQLSLILHDTTKAMKLDLNYLFQKDLFGDKDKTIGATAPNGLRLPSVLNTPECWEIWEQAKEKGLISDNFKWQNGLQLLACFAREMSLRFSLGKGINSNGTKRINWRIFEELFNIEKGKLRSNYNDIQKTGAEPSEINIINEIFGL